MSVCHPSDTNTALKTHFVAMISSFMRGWRFLNFQFSWLIVGLIVALLWLAQIDQASAQSLAGQPKGDNLANEILLPATDPVNPAGESLFSLNCAGCHAHGGNIIRREES